MKIEEQIAIAREGFRYASLFRDNWFSGVNNCPYGRGVPGNDRANAWYRGWWFFHYVVKPWAELIE